MFDASPRDDDSGEEPRAVISILISYCGEVASEIAHDPGDELLIDDMLRQIADDIASGPKSRKTAH